jgi:uncharacterized protein (DUF2141 family)
VRIARNVGILVGRGKTVDIVFKGGMQERMEQFLPVRHLRHLFAITLPLLITRPLPAQAGVPAGAIDLTITGIRVTQGGELIVALYDRPGGWLQTDSALAVRKFPVGADSVMIVTFDSLPPDSGYAITVIHDRNGNGKMDMRWLPYPRPKEGTGVSRNHVRAGPPEYEKARVPVGEATERITIEMRY